MSSAMCLPTALFSVMEIEPSIYPTFMSEQMSSEGKDKQLRWNSLLGFCCNQLNSAVPNLSLGYKSPVHNHIELASIEPMKTRGKVTVPDLLKDADSTQDSKMFTLGDTGADVNDFLSFGFCGLGYLT
jgi:hypothetical protein